MFLGRGLFINIDRRFFQEERRRAMRTSRESRIEPIKQSLDEMQVSNLIRRGEEMGRGSSIHSPRDIVRVTNSLLMVVRFPKRYSWNDRGRAATLLVTLAVHDDGPFDAVREAADEYLRAVNVPGCFPWTPNADEILSRAETLRLTSRKPKASDGARGDRSPFKILDALIAEVQELTNHLQVTIPVTAGIVILLSIVLAAVLVVI
jgi:hypothetical protein